MSFNQELEQLGVSAFQASEALGLGVVKHAQQIIGEDGTGHVFAAIAAAGGALRVVADVIAAGQPGENMYHKGTKESMVVAALIVARIIQPKEEGVAVDFSPRNIVAAIEAASKAVDLNMRNFVNKDMLASYDEKVAEYNLTLGYWDYLHDIGPSFDNLGDDLSNVVTINKSTTRH